MRSTWAVPACLVAALLASGEPPGEGPRAAIAPAHVEPHPATRVTIRGTVVDRADRPIAGVRVGVRDAADRAVAVTDDAGGFALWAAPAAAYVLELAGPHVRAAEVTWRSGDPAPRIQAARRAGLVVRVTAGGRPVAHAEVHATDGGRTIHAVTGDRGLARLEGLAAGPHELWARRAGEVSPVARLAAVDGEVELALVAGDTITGRVIADGALPPDARVTLVPVDVDHAIRVAKPDEHGRFAIEGVARGRWRVYGEAAGHVALHAPVADSRGGEVIVRLARTGAVTGTVVDLDGEPIAGATIVLSADGQVLDRPVTLAPGPVRWVHPLAGRRLLPARDFGRFGAARSGSRPIECGRGHCGVDLGWQRGTIVHAAGDGTVARVVTEDRGEAGRAVAIDHAGGLRTFYLHLDELRAGLEPGQPVRAGEPLGTMGETGAARGPHLHFAITERWGGRSWYVDPEPILRRAVVLASPRPLDPLARRAVVVATELERAPVASHARAVISDAHGRFHVADVAPGRYVAIAAAAELAPSASPRFTVRAGGETAGPTITLRPGTIVEGRVTGRDGPIAGAMIVATTGAGESAHELATIRTDGPGDFTLRALAGTVTLTATAPGHATIERTITLGHARRHREDFALVAEDARLRGQVLAADGGPAGHVTLRVIEGPTRRRAVADASGRFETARVAAGSYVVEVTSDAHPSARVTLEADRWADVRLPAGGAIRCDLRDAHSGAPLAGIRITASGPGERTASAITDARGVAELPALAAGAWTVRVRARGYPETRRTVEVRPTRVPGELRLDLPRGAVLEGVVRDRHGRRVAGARVSIDGLTTRSDADGAFRLADVAPGRHRLAAELDGARGAIELDLGPGDERRALTVELADP